MGKTQERKIEKLKISNNLLFILAFILIALNSYTFIIASKDQITAEAVGRTSVCIGEKPSIKDPSPIYPTVIIDTFNSTLEGNTTQYVDFFYFYFGTGETLFGRDNDTNDDNIFNATLNTTALPDGNCNYHILARAYGHCNVSDVKPSAAFTIDNIPLEPIWDEFENNISTNFSNYTVWSYIPGAQIGQPDFGLIDFRTTNFDGADLNHMFNISNNNILMNVSWQLNGCMNDIEFDVKFFNVTQFAEPIVLKNNVSCGLRCWNLSYSGGNYSFVTRIANEEAVFSIGEGGNLSLNFTFNNYTFFGENVLNNKTFDNSPTINFSTYMHGSIRDIPISATCSYKTDYDPTDFMPMEVTGGVYHSQNLPEQNWSYLPTNMGHYDQIQHHDFYSGLHHFIVNCSVGYQETIGNTTFAIRYTSRDRVFYEDGDTIELYLVLEEPNLNITTNFSQIDSNFDPADVTVSSTGLEYNISYNISPDNTLADGKYNVTIEAFQPSGNETMNGSIFLHLHNNWQYSDIDDAFDCWTWRPGYYFDEVGCDWEADVNRVAKRVIDPLYIEISCFDGMDNEGDCPGDTNGDTIVCGPGDEGVDDMDKDCEGVFYTIRREANVESAFLADPCFNNVCFVCLGTDSNGDGACDNSFGVNVQYLNKVQPGAPLRVKYNKTSRIIGESVRMSINFFDKSFNISNSTSYIEQLPTKQLGYNTSGAYYISVTATTFGPGLPDTFTGMLLERITTVLSTNSIPGSYPNMKVGRSIGGSSWQQDMKFFQVDTNAIINESDNATYCFDGYDNDLNDPRDCLDTTCNLTYNPANSSERCEYATELTCNDGYDNDWDGYIDCEDNDCFKKNGTNGPCYAIEDFNTTSCADSINNDFDWGYYWSPSLGGRGSGSCNSNTSISYEERIEDGNLSTVRLTDCKDIDCDSQTGSVNLSAQCEYCSEITCNDNFDNDADAYYDCEGNAYRDDYERDCDRWNDLLLTCPTTETNCSDEIDNDLDYDSMNGERNWLGIPVFGGWDCQDIDCMYEIGDDASGAICEYRNETICNDGFDNDRDGFTDCDDETSCKGISGADFNLTGLCRPCAQVENISADSCRDNDDTDYDGQTDCADINCTGLPGPGIGLCGFTENNCTDGIDNDFDWLIDENDTECVIVTYTSDELGPGQCDDNIDNDNDGDTDCQDNDCDGTFICEVGSVSYGTCTYIEDVGAVAVYETEFVRAGDNLSVCFRRNPISSTLMFALGNSQYSLTNLTPILDTTTTFMTGNTSNFILIRGSDGLLAQTLSGGFTGNLNFNLVSTTSPTLTPGYYNNFILTSAYGTLSNTVAPVYISENEPPTVLDINYSAGHVSVSPGAVNVTFTANVTDSGTYNSGIALCDMELHGGSRINSSSCTYTTNLSSGTYNVSTIAYDGAYNPSANFTKEMTINVWTLPRQYGNFYNPYPTDNYPDKNFFNNTEKLNIGVNFIDGSGYEDNDTGCIVRIRNSTDVVHTDYINLSVVSDQAHCTGQVPLYYLMNLTDVTNRTTFPSGVYYFDVTVQDNESRQGISEMQDMQFCLYYYDNSSSKYRCRDQCEERGIANSPPILLSDIPNQTWPRGTKLSIIDLDDYFIDPDFDPLTFTWVIDTDRINITIDRGNVITFTPDISFYGFAYVTFYANDPFTSTPSNIVQLEVLFTPIPNAPFIPPSSGGGGGGAARNLSAEKPICEEDWTCTTWGPCLPSGYQFRTCRDRNDCGTTNDMPNTTRKCLYTPTCRDRLRNQGETGVDCGGPCPPCAGCNDGILNQGEFKISQIMSANTKDRSDCGGPLCPPCPTCEDNIHNQGEDSIDCGGPCKSCATCNDKIRNQGEVNIDCGGPCVSCNVKIVATAFNWNLLLLLISSLFLLLLLMLALLFGVFKKKFIRLKAKLLNYYMRSVRMFEKKKTVEKELPIMQWTNTHLDSIEEGIPSKSVEQSVDSIDRLVRILFKRVFLIRYAFTNDELVKELEKHKIPTVLNKAVEILFEELSQIKYGGATVEKDDIKTLAGQVRVITDRLITEIETKKKTKINISDRDIEKISETLSGAHHMGVKEAMKKMK